MRSLSHWRKRKKGNISLISNRKCPWQQIILVRKYRTNCASLIRKFLHSLQNYDDNDTTIKDDNNLDDDCTRWKCTNGTYFDIDEIKEFIFLPCVTTSCPIIETGKIK